MNVACSVQHANDLDDVRVNSVEHEVVAKPHYGALPNVSEPWMVQPIQRPAVRMFDQLTVGLIHRVVESEGGIEVVERNELGGLVNVRVCRRQDRQAACHALFFLPAAAR